jgi:DNA-binding CsgD family transcriptional regulator
VSLADGLRDRDELLERAGQLATLHESLQHVAEKSRGGLILVPGEAGIGKTTLLRRFCSTASASVRVVSTACEPLFTPRPLGPVLELAAELDGELSATIGNTTPFDVATALLPVIRHAAPVVLVIEDVHWADEATLDVIRLLARRVGADPVLLVLSYRNDHLERTHQLRIVLGELAAAGRVLARLSLTGLSRAAVAELAAKTGVDALRLHDQTAGNPFFVTEVIGAGTDSIPQSVHDAVIARAARLSGPARDLLDAAAVVPGGAETWLLEALDPLATRSLDECVGAGMLTMLTPGAGSRNPPESPGRIAFRHEIARLVIEESLVPGRRAALHRAVLTVLEKDEDPPADPARLAHHAEAAGDGAAVLRYARQAAAAAVHAGAHHEAAQLYSRALAFADRLPDPDRADLLERYAEEYFLTAIGEESIAALNEALSIHRSRGDQLAQARILRLLGTHIGRNGKVPESLAATRQAVTILEQLPPSDELALCYVSIAAVYGIWFDPQARDWAVRAIDLGERLGCAEAVYAGLNILGSIEIVLGDLSGVEKLERSRELAEQHRDYLGVARAHLHLCWMLSFRREWLLTGHYLEPAITFCTERGHELSLQRLRGIQMEAQLALGQWAEADAAAQAVLTDPDGPSQAARCDALIVLATLRARRGEPGGWALLDEAADVLSRTGLAYQQLPIAVARAEAAWLAGRPDAVLTEPWAPDPSMLSGDPFAAGALACWRWRAGADSGDPAGLPDPYRLLLSGDQRGAARWFTERGDTYQAALTASGSGSPDALREALDALTALDAGPAAANLARELRALGERYRRRQSRAATSEHPAGLTTREVDVLALLVAGLRNSDIALRLVMSPRTVDHHVSAILRKLDVHTRGEAVAAAIRLGLVQPLARSLLPAA